MICTAKPGLAGERRVGNVLLQAPLAKDVLLVSVNWALKATAGLMHDLPRCFRLQAKRSRLGERC
jgi:hypothetical protein